MGGLRESLCFHSQKKGIVGIVEIFRTQVVEIILSQLVDGY